MNRGKSTIPADEDWETGDDIDWRYYWSIINRRKWSIIGLALAVGLLTTLVVFAMTPIYRASATLLTNTGSTRPRARMPRARARPSASGRAASPA